jgi:hypothetical protein
MAEKKKKKKEPKGMPSGSIKSRMPSSTNKGKAPKKAIKKRSLMERINPFDKESKARRAAKRKSKVVKSKSKPSKKSKSMSASSLIKATKVDLARKKKIGASKATAVRKGAKSVVKTKGGEFVKYKKDSKAAGSFRSAFKSSCSGGAKSFSWDGRSYSCNKASSKKTSSKKVTTKKVTGTAKAGNPAKAGKIVNRKSPSGETYKR